MFPSNDWILKFAESYSGSGDTDMHNRTTSDGSESNNFALQTSNNNGGVQVLSDGQGPNPEWGQANHPSSPDGQNSHDQGNKYDVQDKKNLQSPNKQNDASDKTDLYNNELELPQEGVDDNHSDGGLSNFTASYLGLFKADYNSVNSGDIAGGGDANFLHNAPDSPKTMNDGHPIEELQDDYMIVSNTDKPHADTPAGSMLIEDPSLSDKKKNEYKNLPEINKGRSPANASLKIAVRTEQSLKESGGESGGSNQDGNRLLTDDEMDPLLDSGASNVGDIMYPFEVNQKHNRSTHDFGTGDCSGDEQTMTSKPNQNYSGSEEENNNYSGRNASYLSLFKKVASDRACGVCGRTDYNDIRGRLCDKCAFPEKYKKADYGFVSPSVNPNSGKDENSDKDDDKEKDEDYGNSGGRITDNPMPAMTDGKMITENFNDKIDVDPMLQSKRYTYKGKKTEDENRNDGHWYDYLNSGSSYGQEANGINSGVNPGN